MRQKIRQQRWVSTQKVITILNNDWIGRQMDYAGYLPVFNDLKGTGELL